MFKVNSKNTRTMLMTFLLLILNICETFFSIFIVDFEQVNVSWERSYSDFHISNKICLKNALEKCSLFSSSDIGWVNSVLLPMSDIVR